MPSDPRTTRAYRKLSAQYKQQCRMRNRPCMHCVQPIDYLIEDTNDPSAFTVEHLKPVSQYPHLALDTSHWMPAHRACNSSRGVGAIKPSLGENSRNW